MLATDVRAILTPYNRGSRLPTRADVQRIVDLTPHAYVTARVSAGTGKKRDPAVVRTLKEANIRITPREQEMGMIRMRRNIEDPWSVELFNQACLLSDLYAA